MPTFREERTGNYTVMSNHHLRNEKLSLKAKGLLSQMLSLPEKWNYALPLPVAPIIITLCRSRIYSQVPSASMRVLSSRRPAV